MKTPLNPRRILIRTALILVLLLLACLVCNTLGQLYLPFPND
jgi:hypothetical protein